MHDFDNDHYAGTQARSGELKVVKSCTYGALSIQLVQTL